MSDVMAWRGDGFHKPVRVPMILPWVTQVDLFAPWVQ